MADALTILKNMEAVLDKLILNAEQLKDLSMEEFSEEAVTPLQRVQESLVAELNKYEQSFDGTDKLGQEAELAKIGDRMTKKMRYFQHLNSVFIENITDGSPLQNLQNRSVDTSE